MANTYTALFYHIIFSTKNRTEYIRPDIEERVWAYLGGVARKHKMTAIQIGGVDDHIHALLMAPPTLAPFEIAKYLKGDSQIECPSRRKLHSKSTRASSDADLSRRVSRIPEKARRGI